MKIQTVVVCCLVGLGGLISFAQDGQDRPPREGAPGGAGGRGGPGGPGGGPGPRFVPPLMQALDANKDGIIDETEIANASVALKKLDKNGDGKLNPEELRPPPMEGGRGRPNGPPREGDGQPRPRPPGNQ